MISVAPQFTHRGCRWIAWKVLRASKGGIHQYDDDGSVYSIWFYDIPEVIECVIWKETVPDSVIAEGYSQEQNDLDKGDFEENFKDSANAKNLQGVAVEGTAQIAGDVHPMPLEGRRHDIYTSDFVKQETWWQDSARVEGETLTDQGAHTVYKPATERYWVDVMHGKIFRERELREVYAPLVKVNSTAKTENPAGTTDGDFSVDYPTGAVTFNSALQAEDVVTADYSYVRTSLFKCPAPDGYVWTSNTVKVMYSKNIGMTDSVFFQLWGDVGYGMMPLSSPEIYQTLDDLKKDASRIEWEDAIESGDPGAENAWRMPTSPRVFLYYDYTARAANALPGSVKAEIRCWLENDKAFIGEMGAASFFGRKDEE